MRVLPFLTYVDSAKMSLVIRHFEDVLDFDKFDAEHGADDHAKVEAFVAMCEGIERNQVRSKSGTKPKNQYSLHASPFEKGTTKIQKISTV